MRDPTTPAPTRVALGVTPMSTLRNLRIVDAKSGEEIAKVIEADAEAGKLRRYAVSESGNLIRDKDAYRIVEEDRALRIEWIVPPEAEITAETMSEGDA